MLTFPRVGRVGSERLRQKLFDVSCDDWILIFYFLTTCYQFITIYTLSYYTI